MDSRFSAHNSHLVDAARFEQTDPQMRRLHAQPYQHRSKLLDSLPKTEPGIYTLGGGRQIGKSTLLKQWMADLLRTKTPPEKIAFYTGELIDDHHSLLLLLQSQLEPQVGDQPGSVPNSTLNYVIVDEVTYINQWDKAIKFAADAGLLENTVLILTGSDLSFIQDARMRFPGRRGRADLTDFHLYPLSFREFAILKNDIADLEKILARKGEIERHSIDSVNKAFEHYLQHGGYLTAINDVAREERILPGTFAIYSDWVRGDMIKRGKQEHYLREIVAALIKRYNTQVSWNALARDLSIDHPKTVADYVALLERMDVVFVQSAVLEDKLAAAPKKAKKLMFCDPFILHALRAWDKPVADPYKEQVVASHQDPVWLSKLVESCVATHFRRLFPTYYIKSEGEIDVVYVDQGQLWPIEVKWTAQLRPKDLKQIGKYANAEIWAKASSTTEINGVKSFPLALKLLWLEH